VGAVRTISTYTDGPYSCDGDDDYQQYSLPFTFRGWPYVWVHTNGHVSFAPWGSDYVYSPYGWPYALDPTLVVQNDLTDIQWGNYTPDPVPVLSGIFMWMSDLQTHSVLGSSVSYGTTTIDATEAFVCTWENIGLYGTRFDTVTELQVPSQRTMTFQVVLYPDGSFEMNYDKIEGTYNGGSDAGWGGWDFGDGIQSYFIGPLAGYRLTTYADYQSGLNDADHDDVDEFENSRWLELLPIPWRTANPDAAEYDAYAFTNPMLDGGSKALSAFSNCGVPGRYLSSSSLNLVPSILVDVDLSAELTSDVLSAEGSLDFDAYVFVAAAYAVESTVDIPVDIPTVQAVFGGDTPTAFGDMSTDVGLTASLTVDITFPNTRSGYGGDWSTGGRYDNSQVVSPTIGYSSSGHPGSLLSGGWTLTFHPQPIANGQSWGYQTPFGDRSYLEPDWIFVPTMWGTDMTYSLWVYVETAGKAVTLEAVRFWGNYASFPDTDTYNNNLVSYSSATSTTTGSWEQLSVTVPGANTIDFGQTLCFRLVPSDHQATIVVRTDDSSVSYSGQPQQYGTWHMSYNPYYANAEFLTVPGQITTLSTAGGFTETIVSEVGLDAVHHHIPASGNASVGAFSSYASQFNVFAPYFADGNALSMWITARVRVASGSPDISFGGYALLWETGSSPQPYYTVPLTEVATTSVKGEWVDLTIPYANGTFDSYNLFDATPFSSSTTNGTFYQLLALVGGIEGADYDLEGFYLSYAPDPNCYVFAENKAPRHNTSADVGIEATLQIVSLNPMAEGSITFDTAIDPVEAFSSVYGMEGSITSPITVDGSWYYDKTFSDLNGNAGGNWHYTGAYGIDYSHGYATGSLSTVSSAFGRTYVQHYTCAANTNGSTSWMSNWLDLQEPVYAGLRYTYTVDVYVPSGKPHVKLAFLYPTQPGYLWAQPGYFNDAVNVVVSDTTTVHDAWQTLSVTMPVTNSPYSMALRLYSVDQTSACEWYVDSATWRQYGDFVDPSWHQGEKPGPPNTNDNIAYLGPHCRGSYVSGSPYANTTFTDESVIVRSGKSVKAHRPAVFGALSTTGLAWSKELTYYQGTGYDASAVVKFGAWVYVPSGSPRVRISVYQYQQRSSPYINAYHDIAKPAFSTKWDEWEYIETTMRWVFEYGAKAFTSWSNYLSSYGYICPDGPYDVDATYYVDDMSVTPVSIDNSGGYSVLSIQSDGNSAYPNGTPTAADVQLSGTLVNLTKMVEGAVSYDVELSGIIPFEESVSSTLDFSMESVVGLSARERIFYGAKNMTYYNHYGFEGSGYLGTNDGDYWDYDIWGTGTSQDSVFYRIGGWVPPDGGQGGSANSLMYVLPDCTGTRYYTAEAWLYAGKKAFGLRTVLWVYNPDPIENLVVRVSSGNSGASGDSLSFAKTFGTHTTAKHGEWELVVIDTPAFADWATENYNGTTYPYPVAVEVYGENAQVRRTFYVDNLDFYWYAGESTLSVVSQ
jgi:hypothetical protein